MSHILLLAYFPLLFSTGAPVLDIDKYIKINFVFYLSICIYACCRLAYFLPLLLFFQLPVNIKCRIVKCFIVKTWLNFLRLA